LYIHFTFVDIPFIFGTIASASSFFPDLASALIYVM